MRSIFLALLAVVGVSVSAQKQTFDLISYDAPRGWSSEAKSNVMVYTKTNATTKEWCRISVVKSTASKGQVDADFESEWKELVVSQYQPFEGPHASETQEADGWKIKAGSGAFRFDGKEAMVILTVFSGYGRCASIVGIANSEAYLNEVTKFMEGISLNKPGSGNSPAVQPAPQPQAAATGFQFSTTNFDDGWTSTVQEDWVEVSRPGIKVFLHYPREGTLFPANPDKLTNAAWNILVAPRYRQLSQYKTTYISTYNRPILGMGYATDNKSGQQVFVVLYNQGNSGWIEFACASKNDFVKQFGFDPEAIQWDSNSELMEALYRMKNCNRFAVAASDLKGKWTSDFTGIQQLYHVYTGQYAGMNINQSNEEFVFNGNSYSWKLLAINGMVGNAKFNQVSSTGTFAVPNNWQISFSKIESGPKLYNAFWSCIKGARVLNLLDAQYPGSGIYQQFGLAGQ